MLVNNAGFGLYRTGRGHWHRRSAISVRSESFWIGPPDAAAMREKGAGTIVNISSMGGKLYTLLGAWYHATKLALEGWSDCLRLELAPFGIRVVSEASSMDVFRQWIEDGLASAQDIACEMGVSKGTVSKIAKRGIDSGWLKKNGREYALA